MLGEIIRIYYTYMKSMKNNNIYNKNEDKKSDV